ISSQRPNANLTAAQASAANHDRAVELRAMLDKYCVTCHNGTLKTAGLVLDTIDVADLGRGAEIWEKVVRKLRTHTIPPPGRPRPASALSDGVVAHLESALDRAMAASPDPGRPPAHRLNRAEYGNAIRDLLALDIDAPALLPPDEAAVGFDNIAGSLTVSPAL